MSPRRSRSDSIRPLPGEQPRGQLLGRHLEREHADDIVGVARLARVGRATFRAAAALAAMVTASAVLPMLGRPARMTQVGWLQAAQLLVDAGEPGRHAGDLADLVPGALDMLDRAGQHRGKGAELALGLALLGQVEQLALGQLDLLAAALSAGRRRRRG